MTTSILSRTNNDNKAEYTKNYNFVHYKWLKWVGSTVRYGSNYGGSRLEMHFDAPFLRLNVWTRLISSHFNQFFFVRKRSKAKIDVRINTFSMFSVIYKWYSGTIIVLDMIPYTTKNQPECDANAKNLEKHGKFSIYVDQIHDPEYLKGWKKKFDPVQFL